MELSTSVREKNLVQSRVAVASLGGACLLSLLLMRLIWLQLVETERFQTASEENRLQTLPVGPARGLIIDRNRVVLAENQPNLQLLVVPEEVPDRNQLIIDIRRRIEFTDNDAERFLKNLKMRRRPRDPVVVKDELSEFDAARIAVDLFRFPGLKLEASSFNPGNRNRSTAMRAASNSDNSSFTTTGSRGLRRIFKFFKKRSASLSVNSIRRRISMISWFRSGTSSGTTNS